MRVLTISVTERGSALADALPWEHVHGNAGDTVRARWDDTDAFVLFLATGAATRIVAPLLEDKRSDPAVVCVDEGARYAIALTGGHEAGANLLAHRVAAAIGAEPVVTTATDAISTGLVAGVGCSSDAPLDGVFDLLVDALDGRVPDAVATIDRRAGSLGALGLPVRAFTAEELASGAEDVPNPSSVVHAAVGTPSVAEAAALLAAGPGAALTVPKRKNAVATVAVARRAAHGRLSIVGLGPGSAANRTPAAAAAVRAADVVIGYGPYVDQAADLLRADQDVIRSAIGDEVVRAKQAVAEADAGRRVALVCSGDPGVYAMASLALEVAPGADVEVEVVPGVTAALAAAAVLGAPLGHDHCSVSLSDHLTPWPAIEQRLRAAAEADFVIALYNPRSMRRTWQLDAARDLLRAHRPAGTPVGVVTDAARPTEQVTLTTLGDLDTESVGMTSIVVIGSTTTTVVDGRMVTPRGYLR